MTPKKSDLMPVDVFPSADFMGEKDIFTLYVRVKGKKEIFKRDGYFIYECGVSFWRLCNPDEFKDMMIEIIAWEKK